MNVNCFYWNIARNTEIIENLKLNGIYADTHVAVNDQLKQMKLEINPKSAISVLPPRSVTRTAFYSNSVSRGSNYTFALAPESSFFIWSNDSSLRSQVGWWNWRRVDFFSLACGVNKFPERMAPVRKWQKLLLPGFMTQYSWNSSTCFVVRRRPRKNARKWFKSSINF